MHIADLNSEKMKKHKIDMLLDSILRKAQVGQGKIDEVKSLLNCLHLN